MSARRQSRSPVRLPRAAACALALAAASAWAQVPQSQKPQAPIPGMVYDRYEASQRLRLRAEVCMRDEDATGPNCVKQCATGYVTLDNPPSGPRICRSERALGPGQVQPAPRKQIGVQPVPPRKPSAPVPGA